MTTNNPTLAEFIERHSDELCSNIWDITNGGPSVYVTACRGHVIDFPGLWSLSDYVVTSIGAGVLWLKERVNP